MISDNLSEAEEFLVSLSELNNSEMGVSNGFDSSSSDEVEFIQELKVTLDRHECELCCSGTFLVDKLLRFGGLEGKFACEVCLTSFKSKAKAVAHAKQHGTECGAASPVICCKTGVSVLESAKVTEIGASSKGIDANKKRPLATEKSFSCGACPKRYKYASGLRYHRCRGYGNIMQSGCISEAVERARTESIISIEEPLVFVCDRCQEKFNTKKELKKHKDRCRNCDTASEPLACNVTKEATSTPGRNLQTKNTWIGAMPIDPNAFADGTLTVLFSCSRCQEKFNTKKELKKHKDRCQNCDTASEPLACNVTREATSTPGSNLQTNNTWIGAMTIDPNAFADGTLTVLFSCSSCQEKFSSQKKLKQHYTTHHGQSRDSIVSRTNGESREIVTSIADGNVQRRESIVSTTSNGESSTLAMQSSENISETTLRFTRKSSDSGDISQTIPFRRKSSAVAMQNSGDTSQTTPQYKRKSSAVAMQNSGDISQTTPQYKRKSSAVAMQNSGDISETSPKCRSESGASAKSNPTTASGYWSCDFCLISCKSEKGLKKHNTLQHGPTYFCYVCGTSFKSSNMFKKHRKQKSCVNSPANLKSCPSCNQSFFTERSFDEHVCSLGSD